jgi:hypothetical protein
MSIIKNLKRLFNRTEVNDTSVFNPEKELKLTDQDGESYKYKGEQKNNEPHGFGEAIYESGDIYIGYFNSRKREGLGMYKWKSGDYYVGNWANNERNGFGVNYLKNHETVVFGEFNGLKLIHEEGLISKSLNHNHCIICGQNKKFVKHLIVGGISNRAICGSCTIIALKSLKKEMNYSDVELLDLINNKTV